MKNLITSMAAASMLSSCVVAPPPRNYVHRDQINIIACPVHEAVERLQPLEISPEEFVYFERLRIQEAERNRRILDGRVNNVRGW